MVVEHYFALCFSNSHLESDRSCQLQEQSPSELNQSGPAGGNHSSFLSLLPPHQPFSQLRDCTSSSLLTGETRYSSAWMTKESFFRPIRWLAHLTLLPGARWRMEAGTPTSAMEVRVGVPEAPHATSWENSSATDTGPPLPWAGSFS